MRCASPPESSGREPIEGEIVQAHLFEKPKALLNFFKDLVGDHGFGGVSCKLMKNGRASFHRHLADFRDGAPGDFNGAGFGAETRPAAIGTKSRILDSD